MSDGITDASKHEHELIEEWQRQTVDNFLKDLSKEELIDELCKRDKVHCIEQDMLGCLKVRGSGTIIVVRE